MPGTAQPTSPAELAALEHAFATDPSSDAYRLLTEAYLERGRYLEAVVVCKKGIKAHPNEPGPRVLLARVHAAQGKDRKALEELAAALQRAPGDVAANRMAGLLLLRLGEKEPGIEALRRAWQAAPDDPETLEALASWGLSFEAGEPPPPPEPEPELEPAPAAPAPAPAAAPVRREGPPAGGPPVLTPVTPVPSPAAAPGARSAAAVRPTPAPAEPAPRSAPAPRAAASAQPAPPPRPARQAEPEPAEELAPEARPEAASRNAAYAEELASRYGTKEYTLEYTADSQIPGQRRPRPRHSGALLATGGLALALLIVLGAWWGVAAVRKSRAVEIDRQLRETRELLEKDSYASYKEAAKHCERVLERDPDSIGGHAYLAYIDAIRWGEHGESEGLRDEARKHLEAARRVGKHSHAYAAAAYLRFYGGEPTQAIQELRSVLTGPEGASALLHGVLGILEMRAGDLDAAKQDLALARQAAPGDVRVTQMLAEQWRRRGQGFELQAVALYDTALTRLAPDHVPSLLGRARLSLDAGRADEAMKRIARVLEMGQAASPRQVAVAHALRGWALHDQGKKHEGDAEEQQALALDPSNGDIHDLVGRRKLRGSDAAGAAEAFQRAIALEPARLGFYVDLAGALLQQPGGSRQAVAVLEKAAERVGNARVVKLLGDAYRADGDLDRAGAAYERALTQEKRYPEARLALARVLRDRKDYGKALAQLDLAVKDYGESAAGGAAQAWVEIAATEEARGAAPEVVERAYTSALKADPQSCPALFWLGRSRSVRKTRAFDPTLASQMLGDYLKLCPRGAQVGEAQRIREGLR